MPPLLVAAIPAIVSAGSAVVGAVSAGKDRDAAQGAMNAAAAKIAAIGAPPDQSAAIIRKELQSAGVYTPQLEQAITQSSSQLANLKESGQTRAAQVGALQMLQQRGNTGLTPEDRAAYNQLRRQSATEGQAKVQQILQQAQMRGQAGGGAELAAQLSAAQSGDQNLSEGGDRLAANASKNALEAMTSAGGLAGQVRGQDFSVNSAKAQAADELNRFNTQNQISRQARNTANSNAAQQANLGNAQRIQDFNTAQANEEKLRQLAAQRQNWVDKAQLAGMQASALNGQASQLNASGQQKADSIGKIGSGLAGIAGAVGGNLMNANLSNNIGTASNKLNPNDGITLPEDNQIKIQKY